MSEKTEAKRVTNETSAHLTSLRYGMQYQQVQFLWNIYSMQSFCCQ